MTTNIIRSVSLNNLLPVICADKNREEIIKGLNAKQKYIPCKFFYDTLGSKLFEDITRLEEYYLSHTEKNILKDISIELGKRIETIDIIEFGSGGTSKIEILLRAIPPYKRDHVRYLPLDISYSAIQKSIIDIREKFPNIETHGYVADFMSQLNLIPRKNKRMICFFGSTIGNLTRKETHEFLIGLSENMLPGDELLLGLDMVKDIVTLENAYNDRKEITASFNKNIINVINRMIESEINPNSFEHLSFYNQKEQRIEMHLKAKEYIIVKSPYINKEISFKIGETIHTENSHKFTSEHISSFSNSSGLSLFCLYTDKKNWYSIVHLIKQ